MLPREEATGTDTQEPGAGETASETQETQETTETQETQETQETPEAPEGQEGAEAEFDMDKEDMAFLDQAPTKRAPTRAVLERLAKTDPEAAHALRSLMGDYKKKTGRLAEERRKMESDARSLREAVLNAGFDRAQVPAAPKGKLPEADYLALLTEDPKKFVERLRQEVTQELLGKLPEHLKPVVEPYQRLTENVRKEAARENVRNIIRDVGSRWVEETDKDGNATRGVKVFVDQIIARDTEGRLPFDAVVQMAEGMYFKEMAKREAATRTTQQRARAESAASLGRGGTGRAQLQWPSTGRPRGIVELVEWQEQKRAEGFSEDDIRNFLQNS